MVQTTLPCKRFSSLRGYLAETMVHGFRHDMSIIERHSEFFFRLKHVKGTLLRGGRPWRSSTGCAPASPWQPWFSHTPLGTGGRGRGVMHPPKGQKQVPSPAAEKWVPTLKKSCSLLWYTPVFLDLHCVCRSFFHSRLLISSAGQEIH